MKIEGLIFKAKLITVLTLIAVMISCVKNKSDNNKVSNYISFNDREIFTLYKKESENIISVARALKTDNKVNLYLYSLNISAPESVVQNFQSVQALTLSTSESKKSELLKTFSWIPMKKPTEVLFIQIQPANSHSELKSLDIRQKVEEQIDTTLRDNNLGEWFAGDLGPGGANMLFTVKNVDKSLPLIFEILAQNRLEKNVVIGRRKLIDEENWFYEVIFPTNFSGNFNTM